MKRILILLLYLCSLFFFFSCTPERQLNRLRVYHPEMFNSTKITDTVFVPGLNADTVFITSKTSQIDTFQLVKNLEYGQKKQFSIKIIRHRDTIRVTTVIPADTIYKDIQVEKFQTCERKHIEDFVKYAVWSLIGLAVLLILIFIVVGLIKRGIL